MCIASNTIEISHIEKVVSVIDGMTHIFTHDYKVVSWGEYNQNEASVWKTLFPAQGYFCDIKSEQCVDAKHYLRITKKAQIKTGLFFFKLNTSPKRQNIPGAPLCLSLFQIEIIYMILALNVC